MNKLLRVLGATRIEKDSVEFKWGYIAKGPSFKLILNRGGYFDSRYSLDIGFLFGYINIKLPFNTMLGEGCDLPRYGIQIHDGIFWLHIGGKFDKSIGQVQGKSWITWDLPFFTWLFDNHWIVNKEGEYQLGGKKLVKMKDGTSSLETDYDYEYALRETHPFKYTLRNGEVQERTATIYQEKMQWHRKWFPMFKRTKVSIDVQFSDEVGEGTGSWKGGVIGSSYPMLPNEKPIDTLRRMEKERKFR